MDAVLSGLATGFGVALDPFNLFLVLAGCCAGTWIPQPCLTPLIAILAFIGIYAIAGDPFDLLLVTGLGVFGWFLRKLDFSLAPVIRGFVPGSLFENNLRRAPSISGGDWGILVADRKSLILYAPAVAVVAAPIWLACRARRTEGDVAAGRG